MKINTLLSLTLLLALHVNAQQPELPKITPPSPTAQTFMRYGEIPVDYSTGVPSIEIPIYTLEGKKLGIPISISYHASGIRVNDIASEVGLGWALNCGGMISRSVNGKRDEANSSRTFYDSQELLDSLNVAAPIWEPSSGNLQGILNFENFFDNVLGQVEDNMNDRYFYRLPNGTSGVFTYDFNSLSTDENSVIMLPYRPYRVQKEVANISTFPTISKFTITDDSGIIYTFEPYLTSPSQTISDWVLTEMATADGTDKINFNYIPQNAHATMSAVTNAYEGSPEFVNAPCLPNPPTYSLLPNSVTPLPIFNTPILESIVSSRAIVSFQYDDREDFGTLQRLTQITIAPVDAPENIIKTIQLDNDAYFGTTDEDKRMRLESVEVSVPGSTESQEYTFGYESQILPPYPGKMASPKYNEDFWGYYNGINKSTLLPWDFISNTSGQQNYGANREANLSLSKACMLKEINYPTGGKTVFEFERHFANNLYPYRNDPNDRDGYVGGFRVKTITNRDENDQVANIRTYQYMDARFRQVEEEFFSFLQGYADIVNDCKVQYMRDLVYSSSFVPLEVAPGMPIMYRTVVEYNGTPTQNSGKTVYRYNEPYSPNDYESSTPVHEQYFEYQHPIFYNPYHFDKGNYVPQLISKKAYEYDGTAYRPVSEEAYEYSRLFTTEFTTGIKLTKTRRYTSVNFFTGIQCQYDMFACSAISSEYLQTIHAIDTKAYQEADLLTNSKTYFFHPQDSTQYVLSSTDFLYDQDNIRVKEKTTWSSQGKLLRTSYKYPQDYPLEQPYQDMVTENILAPVIEETSEQLDDINATPKLLGNVRTDYQDWGNSIIAPESIRTQKGGSSPGLEDRIEYLSYDGYGNPNCVKKTDGTPISYLWGYNHTLPIAKIENSDFSMASNQQGWGSGQFSFNGTMVMGSSYNLIGSFTLEEGADNVTVFREYYNDGTEATYAISIKNGASTIETFYNDDIESGEAVSTNVTYTGTVDYLPPGTYTIETWVNYQTGVGITGVGSEVNVWLSGSNTIETTFPFHTSFEEDEGQQISTDQSRTGRKSHLGSYTVYLPPTSSGYGQVVVSYWGKTGASAPWEYVKETVSTTSTVSTMTINGYAYIDEVRIYPTDAMVTTYTYNPLVGVTSITDPRGQTVYYEYDSFNRLKYVRDSDGNILSENEYHYADQN